MTDTVRKRIEDLSLTLLLEQRPEGEYALSFLDLRRIVLKGAAVIEKLSSYEAVSRLPVRAEGITVKNGDLNLILYDDTVTNIGRRNWTIAHEIGHVLLGHGEASHKNEREADAFASELLMPEAVIRFLDCRKGAPITPEEMTNYFAASLTACKRRRLNIKYGLPHSPSEKAVALITRLFKA